MLLLAHPLSWHHVFILIFGNTKAYTTLHRGKKRPGSFHPRFLVVGGGAFELVTPMPELGVRLFFFFCSASLCSVVIKYIDISPNVDITSPRSHTPYLLRNYNTLRVKDGRRL